jgi:hypothetical protein
VPDNDNVRGLGGFRKVVGRLGGVVWREHKFEVMVRSRAT